MSILADRAKMMAEVFGREGLARRVALTPNLEARVQGAATDYIIAAVETYSMQRGWVMEMAATLPNVTPNGAIRPKREILARYRNFFRDVVAVARSVCDLDKFSYASIPQLRIVSGKSDAEKEKRPYATTKLHSEFWVGQPFDINCLLPLLGDTDKTRVEFYVPCDIDGDIFRLKYDDYDEPARFAFGYAEPLNLGFEPGNLYVHDNYILHKTVKSGGGDRLSVDWGMLYKGRGSGEHNPETIYLPIEKWAKADLSGIEFPSAHK